jgi:hypothetical protein
VLAVTWSDLVAGGFFIAGIGLGVVITLRVGRMVGRFLAEIRDEQDQA